MKIVIDARMIITGSMDGIARYVFYLLQGLRHNGKNHQFYILVNPNTPLEKYEWPAHMHLVQVKSAWISFREHWEIPRILRTIGADLYHAPSFVAPIFTPCRLVMTIHDLNHLVLPQFYTTIHQFYYQFIVRSCIRRSEYILTVSHFSKDEIVRNLGLPTEKIFVTYNGVSNSYRPVADEDTLAYVRDIYQLPPKFILCLSNNKPHKNVQQLVRAYCYSNIEMPLALACPVDSSIIRIAEHYGKKHQIFFTKFIAEEHLPVIYSLTHLFVFPSTYEGFGLPPLEAISCGTPVVVARSASLPEVVGENAIFVDPYDYKAIADALQIGISDEPLRQKLRRNGLEHAKRFSWKVMSEKTLEIYERCLLQPLSREAKEVLST